MGRFVRLSAWVLWMIAASASAQTIGSWQVGLDGNGLPYMLTVNENGNAIGKWCDGGSCYWMIASSQITCKQGSSAPVLMNTNDGAYSTTMTCANSVEFQKSKLCRSLLANPDALDTIAVKSDRLGIAVAMQDGLFRVIEFSMAGSDQALSRWKSLLAGAVQRRSERSSFMAL
jgi:hypothetical protein